MKVFLHCFNKNSYVALHNIEGLQDGAIKAEQCASIMVGPFLAEKAEKIFLPFALL
jgi:hypothetical protein